MRFILVFPILLCSCLNLEIENKPCRTDEGCPVPFFCSAGYCTNAESVPNMPSPDILTSGSYRYNPDIQNDIKGLTCSQSGCHSATATNKLKIDTTPGQERNNYDALIGNKLVTPGNSYASPLIVVPASGTSTSQVGHVKTLTSTKLTAWESWVRNGAPF